MKKPKKKKHRPKNPIAKALRSANTPFRKRVEKSKQEKLAKEISRRGLGE